jgi:sec-independent protein translocase protein TatA
MGSMSIVHWLIVLFVVVLLFGPRRLPDLARGMGEAIREFKKAINGNDQQKPQITENKNTSTSERV